MKADDNDNDPMAALPNGLKQNLTRYKAPPGLERRIRYTLAQQSRGSRLLAGVHASWSRWLTVGHPDIEYRYSWWPYCFESGSPSSRGHLER